MCLVRVERRVLGVGRDEEVGGVFPLFLFSSEKTNLRSLFAREHVSLAKFLNRYFSLFLGLLMLEPSASCL